MRFIGDLHLGHVKVSEIRGFETTEEHDAVIMKQLKAVPESELIWLLGDISSGRPEAEDRALELLSEIKAPMNLISGNHDNCSSIHRNSYKQHHKFREVFQSIQDFAKIKLFNTQILMSHYPYAEYGDGPGRLGARYLEFRLPNVGFPLIHAHTHQETKHMHAYGDWEDALLEPGEPKVLAKNQFCVSWDVNRGMVTEQEVVNWIIERRTQLENQV